MISRRAPSLMRGILVASIEEIIRVVIIQNAKFILSADATVQRLTILPELNVGQSSGDALRPVGVERIDVDGSPDIMLMYGKEASNRKQEIDRQHYTIPNQRPKDKHCGKI